MADGQAVTGGSYFDQLNASLKDFREKKQRTPALVPSHVPQPLSMPTNQTPVSGPESKPFSFDALQNDLTQRRKQRGDQTPISFRPQAESGWNPLQNENVKQAASKAMDWYDRKTEQLGAWTAKQLTYTPEEIKKHLDKVPSNVFKALH